MSVTIDVWCNPKVLREPHQVLLLEEDDPCEVEIQFEHSDGCLQIDLFPFFFALGINMILAGIILQYIGPRFKMTILTGLVRMITFLLIVGFAYAQNYFASIDPTEP